MMQRAKAPRPRAGLKNPTGIDPDGPATVAPSQTTRHRQQDGPSSRPRLRQVAFYPCRTRPWSCVVLCRRFSFAVRSCIGAREPRLKSTCPYLHENHPRYEPVKWRSTGVQPDSPMNLATQNRPPGEALIDWLAGRWRMKSGYYHWRKTLPSTETGKARIHPSRSCFSCAPCAMGKQKTTR
jgi:hypothetical protein